MMYGGRTILKGGASFNVYLHKACVTRSTSSKGYYTRTGYAVCKYVTETNEIIPQHY